MDRKQINRLLLVALLLGLVAAFFGLGLQDVLTLEKLRASHQALVDWRQQSPITAALLYLVIYTMATGLLIPGAAVLTLAGGAIFGLGLGTLLTSFASSLGALLGFLVARYLLHDVVKRRFGRQLEPIEQGFKRDGVLYLLSLRLVPVFPIFCNQYTDGADSDEGSDFLSDQPARDASWHPRLCQRRHTTR